MLNEPLNNLQIPSQGVLLEGTLFVPEEAVGLGLFVHGSGSSRFSIRNQFVAELLNRAKFATLLFDLLTREEEQVDNNTREFRFNVSFLAQRLIDVTHWSLQQALLKGLAIGYFGASTGAGAALLASVHAGVEVKAMVSRGGRPDLAGHLLSEVKIPTLLIVGGNDPVVIQMNQEAYQKMKCQRELKIVAKAGHLFEEPGTLEEVANLAQSWFKKYLLKEERDRS